MCLQCIVSATMVGQFKLGGIDFAVMQSNEEDPEWPKGYFGLVWSDDPILVVSNLVPEPPEDAPDGAWSAWLALCYGPFCDALDRASWMNSIRLFQAGVAELGSDCPITIRELILSKMVETVQKTPETLTG